jgi:hypothetical protein
MALQTTLTRTNNFNQQSVLTDVYIKVASIYATKNEVHANVSVFTEANGTLLFTAHYVFPMDLEGSNPIKQSYEYLKTLPEFSDAVDC